MLSFVLVIWTTAMSMVDCNFQVISGDDGCDTQASEAADAGTTATHHVIAMPSSSTTKIYYQKLE